MGAPRPPIPRASIPPSPPALGSTALEAALSSVLRPLLEAQKATASEIHKQATATSVLCKSFQDFRLEQELDRKRIAVVERRVGNTIVEHREGHRQASESDARLKIAQDQQAIDIQETKNLSTLAVSIGRSNQEAIARLEKTSKSTALETSLQTPMIATVSNSKGWVLAGGLVNLAIGVIYLVIEALKHFGSF